MRRIIIIMCWDNIIMIIFSFPATALVLQVQSTAPTSISVSWTSTDLAVVSYEVRWQRDTSGDCPNADEGNITLAGGSTSYSLNITELEEYSSYNITLTSKTEVVKGKSSVPAFTKEICMYFG